MFAWKKNLAGLGLAITLAVFGAASEARAQTVVKIIEVESEGGFTISNDKTTVWANLNAAGRITSGLIQVERKFKRGVTTPTSVFMTGSLRAAETSTLWNAIYAARPWALARVRAERWNTDFPNTKVTYYGRYTQTIIAGSVDRPPYPVVSAAMKSFLGLAGNASATVAAGELFTYQAAGGRTGYVRTITITRDGNIEDEVTYTNPSFAGQGYVKTGRLTPDEINGLHGAARLWSSWPAAFPGNPQAYDGIGITVSFWRWGQKKSVFAGEAQGRPRDFQGAINLIESLAGNL